MHVSKGNFEDLYSNLSMINFVANRKGKGKMTRVNKEERRDEEGGRRILHTGY